MKALSWINFILGLWLILAGFVISGGVRPVMTEEIVLGVIIAVLSYIAAIRPGSAASWMVAIAGLWTLFAPAVITYMSVRAARANDITVGIIVLVLGLATAVYHPAEVRTHA
jgi:hypothetical protein